MEEHEFLFLLHSVSNEFQIDFRTKCELQSNNTLRRSYNRYMCDLKVDKNILNNM